MMIEEKERNFPQKFTKIIQRKQTMEHWHKDRIKKTCQQLAVADDLLLRKQEKTIADM